MEIMEKEDREDVVSTTTIQPKKRRSTMSIIRAAILAIRRSYRSKKTTIINADAVVNSPKAADAMLKTLVGGVRPLHLRLEYRPPFPLLPPPPPAPAAVADVVLDSYPSSECSAHGGMSRYASAQDLPALDTDQELVGAVDGGADEAADDEGREGDANAIDMRAEEFIASFYEQMRLQRQVDQKEEEVEV